MTSIFTETYLSRFAIQVYQKAYRNDTRKYHTVAEFIRWVETSIGSRPSHNYHLFLTGDFESPAEWREINKNFIKDYLNETSK